MAKKEFEQYQLYEANNKIKIEFGINKKYQEKDDELNLQIQNVSFKLGKISDKLKKAEDSYSQFEKRYNSQYSDEKREGKKK